MKIEEWMGEILTAGLDTLQSSLEIETFKVETVEHRFPAGPIVGAYLPIINAEDSLLVGILASPSEAQAVASHFCHHAPENTACQSEEIKDSFKELVNIFSGILKRQLYERTPILKSGLPVFIEGGVTITPQQQVLCSRITLWSEPLYFLVIYSQSEYGKTHFELPEQRHDAAHVSIQDWMGETLTAAFLFSQTALGVAKYKVRSIHRELNRSDLMGAYMPLIGADDAVLIGILSTRTEFTRISRVFLGMSPEEDALSEADMIDAVKEILNILVGLIKRRIFQHNPFMRTGFPIFVDGYIELTGDQEAIHALVEIGDAATYVTVIRKKIHALVYAAV